MLVAGMNLQLHGKLRGRGQPVPEASTWSSHVYKSAREAGRLIDVTEPEAAAMQAEEAKKERAAEETRNKRAVAEARAKATYSLKVVKTLQAQLMAAQSEAESLVAEVGRVERAAGFSSDPKHKASESVASAPASKSKAKGTK